MPFYSRKNPRAQRYDYQSEGMYFVTICTKHRECYFGRIQNQTMTLSEVWNICEKELKMMLSIRSSVEMFNYVIMPNHIHLLFYKWDNNVSLWEIIGQFKAGVTRHCDRENLKFWWQSRYHDIIVRNENDYVAIDNYIETNVENWWKDKFYKIWEEI